MLVTHKKKWWGPCGSACHPPYPSSQSPLSLSLQRKHKNARAAEWEGRRADWSGDGQLSGASDGRSGVAAAGAGRRRRKGATEGKLSLPHLLPYHSCRRRQHQRVRGGGHAPHHHHRGPRPHLRHPPSCSLTLTASSPWATTGELPLPTCFPAIVAVEDDEDDGDGFEEEEEEDTNFHCGDRRRQWIAAASLAAALLRPFGFARRRCSGRRHPLCLPPPRRLPAPPLRLLPWDFHGRREGIGYRGGRSGAHWHVGPIIFQY